MESRTHQDCTPSEEKPKPSLEEALGRRRVEVERRRSDIAWKAGLLTPYVFKRIESGEMTEEEAAQILAKARVAVKPELRRIGMGWDGHRDRTELRAFALLDYIEDCLVLTGDRFVPEETKQEARAAIDHLWGRGTGLGSDIERRGVFALAFEEAADAVNKSIMAKLQASPPLLVAIHLESYDPELASTIAGLPTDRIENLLAHVRDERPGIRKKAAGKRKWQLLSKLWEELTGDVRAAAAFQQDFKRTKDALGMPRRDGTPRKRAARQKTKRTRQNK